MKIIIYGSQYGTAKKYAEELARRTGIDAKNFKEISDINCYDTLVYIGGLYAGGVLGLKKTFAKLSQCQGKKIIIATVGLADPTDAESIGNIKSSIKRQLSKELYESAYFFHLRGGIDYSRLNFKHKTMMGLLYKKAIGLPEDEKSTEVKAMIETYNQKVDFVDFESLNDLIDNI